MKRVCFVGDSGNTIDRQHQKVQSRVHPADSDCFVQQGDVGRQGYRYIPALGIADEIKNPGVQERLSEHVRPDRLQFRMAVHQLREEREAHVLLAECHQMARAHGTRKIAAVRRFHHPLARRAPTPGTFQPEILQLAHRRGAIRSCAPTSSPITRSSPWHRFRVRPDTIAWCSLAGCGRIDVPDNYSYTYGHIFQEAKNAICQHRRG